MEYLCAVRETQWDSSMGLWSSSSGRQHIFFQEDYRFRAYTEGANIFHRWPGPKGNLRNIRVHRKWRIRRYILNTSFVERRFLWRNARTFVPISNRQILKRIEYILRWLVLESALFHKSRSFHQRKGEDFSLRLLRKIRAPLKKRLFSCDAYRPILPGTQYQTVKKTTR